MFCARRAAIARIAHDGPSHVSHVDTQPAASPDSEAKPKKAKAKPITETTVMPDGYTLRPPSLIYKCAAARPAGLAANCSAHHVQP